MTSRVFLLAVLVAPLCFAWPLQKLRADAEGDGLQRIYDKRLLQIRERAVQDPITKVVYYVESDQRHVAAIDPAGKLLWCCEVIPPAKKWAFITEIDPKGEFLEVVVWRVGQGGGKIDKKTGVYTDGGATL
jgi:hypothetical protein